MLTSQINPLTWALDLTRETSYIRETYIDKTEIRSPTISGNEWYFRNLFEVWLEGIVIDWENKLIKSANYGTNDWEWNPLWWQIDNNGDANFNNGNFRWIINATWWIFSWWVLIWEAWIVLDWIDKSIYSANYNLLNKVWFKFKEDGTFLLWKDTSNYLEFDWTNFNFSWAMNAWAWSTIDFAYVDWATKPSDNATVWAIWGTNLSNIPDSATASYITSTKITSTTIESPFISGNNWYFSWIFKVWASWIIIDWINETIRSDNFVSWSTWWQIDNISWVAEFQDWVFRWTIEASNLTWELNLWNTWVVHCWDTTDFVELTVDWWLPKIQFADDWFVSTWAQIYYNDQVVTSALVIENISDATESILLKSWTIELELDEDTNSINSNSDISLAFWKKILWADAIHPWSMYYNWSYWFFQDMDWTYQFSSWWWWVTDHWALTWLWDNDHPQYLLNTWPEAFLWDLDIVWTLSVDNITPVSHQISDIWTSTNWFDNIYIQDIYWTAWIEIDIFSDVDMSDNWMRRVHLTDVWNWFITGWDVVLATWNPTTTDPWWSVYYIPVNIDWLVTHIVVKH